MHFFEASALDKTNVNEAFNYLMRGIYLEMRKKDNNSNNNDDKIGQQGISLNTNKIEKKKCCKSK